MVGGIASTELEFAPQLNVLNEVTDEHQKSSHRPTLSVVADVRCKRQLTKDLRVVLVCRLVRFVT